MRLRFLTTVATALAATLTARAYDLVIYGFDGNLNAQVQQGVTATAFSGDGGSDAVIGTGSSSGNYGYILIKKASDSIGQAVSNNQFAQFTITPPPQQGMQFGNVQIVAARGASTSPRGIALRWSFDNYQSSLAEATIGSTWPSTRTYNLSFGAFSGVPVTFRIYAYAKDSQAEASIRFDKITFTGTNVVYPPTITPTSRRIEVAAAKTSALVTGSAYSSVGIRRVEFSTSRGGVFSGANGTSSWNFTATNLRYGRNLFFVRAISTLNQYTTKARITVIRKRPHPTPTPTPKP